MYFKKEQYREFERNLFIYEQSEAFKPVEAPKTPEVKNESSEVQEAAERDMPKEIQDSKNKVEEAIKKIEDAIPEDQKEAAKVFLDQVKQKATDDFEEIKKEYLELIKKGEITYKGSRFEARIKRKAEDLAERIIERDLKGRQAVKELTKNFLKDVPNTEAKDNEKKLFTELIQNDPQLKNDYGEKGESRLLEKVVKLLAKKFDLRFDKDGNLLYGIDLTDNKVYPAEGENNLKSKITAELKKEQYTLKDVRKEKRELRKETKELKNDRIEVKRNKLFHPEGGKVNTWEEFTSGKHEALSDLRRVNKEVKDQIDAIEEAKRAAEAELRLMERKGTILEQHNQILVQADLNQKFTEAEAKGYKLISHERPDITQDNYTDKAVLQSPDGNTEITVTVQNEQITLTIENKTPEVKFKTERSFADAIDFKNQINLVDEAENQGATIKANRKTVENFEATTYQEGVKQFIPPKSYNDTELANPNFQLEPSPIMFEGQKVGNLTMIASDSFTLEVGDLKTEGVTKENLPKALKELREKMKEIAELGEKRKTEILAQTNATENGIVEGANYKVNKKENLEGDFTDLKGYVEIASLNRIEDQSVVARISLAVEGQNGVRLYKLETEDGRTELFQNANELNVYLAKNGGEIAKPKETSEQLTEPRELKEKAKENIIKMSKRLYPNLNLENLEKDTKGYLNRFLNDIGEKNPDLLNKMANTDDLLKSPLTKEESQAIIESVAKSYGMDKLEKPDEAEMKLISEIEVTIQGKNENFKEFFGEEVVKMVSMTQKLESQNGKTMIQKGGEWVQPTAENMIDSLPTEVKENYQKVLEGKEVNNKEANKSINSRYLRNLESLTDCKKLLESPEMTKSMEKMSNSEKISSVLVAMQLIIQWIKDGDMQSASDAWEAFNSQEGLDGTLEKSKKVYKQVIEKADFATLLAVHTDPNGKEAKGLLGEKSKTPFRGQLKDVATERLQSIFGQGTKIKAWEGDRVVIGQQEKEYEVYLVPVTDGKDFIKMAEIKVGASPQYTTHEFEGLTGTGRTLETVFAEMRGVYTAPPTIQETPVTPDKVLTSTEGPKVEIATPKRSETDKANESKENNKPKKTEQKTEKPIPTSSNKENSDSASPADTPPAEPVAPGETADETPTPLIKPESEEENSGPYAPEPSEETQNQSVPEEVPAEEARAEENPEAAEPLPPAEEPPLPGSNQ